MNQKKQTNTDHVLTSCIGGIRGYAFNLFPQFHLYPQIKIRYWAEKVGTQQDDLHLKTINIFYHLPDHFKFQNYD